ncbi:hypothetical protein GCM10009826_28950 [Humibacillus xanthopallidus]
MINGLLLGGKEIRDNKPSRILTALLLKASETVDGDSLAAAGWYDDPEERDTSKIRGNAPGIKKLLTDHGITGYSLEAKGTGAYSLTLDRAAVDLLDIADRLSHASDLADAGEPVAALKQLEPVMPLLHPTIKTLGRIKPPTEWVSPDDEVSIWIEEVTTASALREHAIASYFGGIVKHTNYDADGLLLALGQFELESVALPTLWELRVGLTAHLGDTQRASELFSDAKIALTKLGVHNELDTVNVSTIEARVARWLDERANKPTYILPATPGATREAQKPMPSRAEVSATRSDLAAERDRLLSLKVTGSSTLTLRDLDSNTALRMPATASIRAGANRNQPIADVVKHLTEKLRDNGEQYLIVAPPGAGKSLVCRLIFLALAARLPDNVDRIPVLIDLRAVNLSKAAVLTDGRDVVVMDSLDELLASGTLPQVREAIENESLQGADVIACRTQFYEQFLTGTTLVEGRTVLEMRPWDVPTIERYIDAYHRHVFHTDDLSVVEGLKRRLESPNVESLLSIPLRLNMALDLIPPGENNLPLELNSLSLHRQWIVQTLRNEAARRGSVLESADKLDLLTHLAWRFYDEGTPGLQTAPSFTDGQIRQALTEMLFDKTPDEVKAYARDLELHSILIGAEAVGSGTTQFDSFEFMHKTFQEFLVARYIINAAKTGPEAAASVFRQYLSPQVSDFIKDELKNTSSSSGIARQLAQNLQGALASYDREAAREPDSIRLRSTIQQICYYLSSLPLEPVRNLMLDRLAIEHDPWVSRGLAIGLSFGGETKGIDQYIESLRRERTLGRTTAANDLNIGYHLSFFGDQPFDPVQPYLDRRLNTVSSTVSRLIYQLSIETDFGSWRLDLYTILDLYHHRTISRDSVTSTLFENRDLLNWVQTHFQSDPRTKDWPETRELGELLDELGVRDD